MACLKVPSINSSGGTEYNSENAQSVLRLARTGVELGTSQIQDCGFKDVPIC